MPQLNARTAPAALLLMLAAGSAWADQLHVPAQYPTVQAAIDAAADGDEIVIAEGTYRELLDGQNKSLTYTGAGMGLTVLSGDLDADGTPDGTVLRVNDSTATTYPTLTMRDLAVREGANGVVVARAGDTTIVRCEFLSCSSDSASSGRGLSVDGGGPLNPSLIIDNCRFAENERAVYAYGFGSAAITGTVVENNMERGVVLEFADLVTMTHSSFMENAGGAVECLGGVLVFSDCRFEGNSAELGAAVLAEVLAQSLSVERCIFDDNHAQNGGALFSSVPLVEIRDCDFRGNSAGVGVPGVGLGAAANIFGGVAVIERSSFVSNAGASTGPLNFGVSYATPSRVTDCTFVRNGRSLWPGETMVTKGGGGLCVESGRLLVEACVFRENHAQEAGAVMFLSQAQSSAVRNCYFLANRATGHGGAIAGFRLNRAVSSVFVGNTAGEYAGAVSSLSSAPTPTVANSIFVDNASPSGAIGVYRLSQPPPFANCIFAVRSRFGLFADHADGDGVIETIDLHPSNLLALNHATIGFVRLPNDGGDGWGDDLTTPDIDEGANDDFGDLRLTPGSPAIDAGDNSAIPLDTYDIDDDDDTSEPIAGEFDLAGNPRFVDAPGMPNLYPGTAVGGPIDLGPYEFQGVSCWADVNADGTLSPADFGAWIGAFNTNKPRADQNRDGAISPADFGAWITNFNEGC